MFLMKDCKALTPGIMLPEVLGKLNFLQGKTVLGARPESGVHFIPGLTV